jgi:hypothetical protein
MDEEDLVDDFSEDFRDDFDDDEDFDLDSDPDSDLIDGVGFANPGGNSALRAATPNNPRNQPCPTCGEPNRLTPIDVQLGYCCDDCADAAERGW